MKQIKQFREDPKSFLGKLTFIKAKKKIKDYVDFINSLNKMPPLVPDKDLFELAKNEMEKFNEDSDSNYKRYQIGEEFQNNLSSDFVKNEVALIALETLENVEEIIQRIIINDSDEDKKGRVILTNTEYTHIGFSKSEENSIILVFAKKEVKKEETKEQTTEEKKEDEENNISKQGDGEGTKEANDANLEEEMPVELTEEEKSIMQLIKSFRENPKSFADKKGPIKAKKKKVEYENFINSLEKMKELKPDKELFDIAKEEIKILIEDSEYNKIQIGQEFKPKISEKFIQEQAALIAIEEVDEIDNIIQKIIINDSDSEKKGRNIITNEEYTHIGFCLSEESSIIFIFAKEEIKEKGGEVVEEKPVELTEDEHLIFNQIKEFRDNPKSFLDKKGPIKAKKKKEDYENFIKTLNKMNELKLNQELCEIAKEEVKISIDDDKYNKIQIGDNVRDEIKEKLPNKEIAILLIEEVDKIENIIQKIIINDSDKDKKGRSILTDISFTHIGISQYSPPEEEEDDKPIAIIFSKNFDKNKTKENINNSKESDKEKDEEHQDSQIIKNEILNKDNNQTTYINKESNNKTSEETKQKNDNSSGERSNKETNDSTKKENQKENSEGLNEKNENDKDNSESSKTNTENEKNNQVGTKNEKEDEKLNPEYSGKDNGINQNTSKDENLNNDEEKNNKVVNKEKDKEKKEEKEKKKEGEVEQKEGEAGEKNGEIKKKKEK